MPHQRRNYLADLIGRVDSIQEALRQWYP